MQNFELENLNKYINWLIDQVEGRLKFRKPSWWERLLGEKERKEMKTEILDELLDWVKAGVISESTFLSKNTTKDCLKNAVGQGGKSRGFFY
jgi:hypothetical protein